VLENHVRLGSDTFKDPELAVATLADHTQRIRKQALNEKLVRPLKGDDGTCGRLSIGDALMAADSDVYRVLEAQRLAAEDDRPSFTREELAEAIRAARKIIDATQHESWMDVAPDLDEKMEAVQHFFEVTNVIPDTVRRPSSLFPAAGSAQ